MRASLNEALKNVASAEFVKRVEDQVAALTSRLGQLSVELMEAQKENQCLKKIGLEDKARADAL